MQEHRTGAAAAEQVEPRGKRYTVDELIAALTELRGQLPHGGATVVEAGYSYADRYGDGTYESSAALSLFPSLGQWPCCGVTTLLITGETIDIPDDVRDVKHPQPMFGPNAVHFDEPGTDETGLPPRYAPRSDPR